MDVGYFRRTFVNFSASDNRAVGPEDYDEFVITVAEDPRLPGGGGFPVTLTDLKPESIRIADRLTTSANQFGGESRTFNGLDATVNARIRGLLLQGGVSTGKTSTDDCAQQAVLPENVGDGGPLDFCKVDGTFLTQVSMSGAYTFPYDIIVSASFFSRTGPEREALYTVPDADLLAALGRETTRATPIDLNVMAPRSEYGERTTQLDVRFGKAFSLGTTGRLRANFDLYNVFNAAAVSQEIYALGQSYLQPAGLQAGRLAKFSFQFDF